MKQHNRTTRQVHPAGLLPWRASLFTSILLSCLWAGGGCTPKEGVQSQTDDSPSPDQLLEFYSPVSIKILPFTKVRSFDEDIIPDGLEVSLWALDRSEDSVKVSGTFQFELYEYRPAAGEPHGKRVNYWEQTVGVDDHKMFWERVTKTYQFQLSWENQPLKPGARYILDVRFKTPSGKWLNDSYEFEFRIDRQEIRDALKQ